MYLPTIQRWLARWMVVLPKCYRCTGEFGRNSFFSEEVRRVWTRLFGRPRVSPRLQTAGGDALVRTNAHAPNLLSPQTSCAVAKVEAPSWRRVRPRAETSVHLAARGHRLHLCLPRARPTLAITTRWTSPASPSTDRTDEALFRRRRSDPVWSCQQSPWSRQTSPTTPL